MTRMLLAVLATVLALWAAPLAAQDETPAINYDQWEQVAGQVEALTDNRDAAAADLSRAREQIADWRLRFQEAQNVNSGRIATLNDQIAALGPAPAEGETEPEEVAKRRAELTQQLATLQAPRISAVEAFSRADSIIGTIDRITRERQAQQLARQSPSPLLPSSWAAAVSGGLDLAAGIGSEVDEFRQTEGSWSDLRPNLPRVAAYLIAALVLLTMGRRRIGSLPSRLSARASEHSRAVVAFLVSFGQIAVPMVGVILLMRAITATGLTGEWTTPLLQAVPIAAVIGFSGTWLAAQLFPRRAIAYDTLQMPEARRNAARHMVHGLALVFAIHHVLSAAILPLSGLYERVGDAPNRVPIEFSEGGAAVWHLAIMAVAGLLLFRLGNILRRLPRWGKNSTTLYRHTVLGWAGYLSRAVVVASLLAVLLGYVNIGNALLWPWILTLALLCTLVLLQDFVADLFNMLKRGKEGAREGLAPLLIGFALVVMSVPVLMVIWGARRTDLAEYWIAFTRGVSLGGITLSPGAVLTFIVVFAIGFALTRGVQSALRTSILPKTRLDMGGQTALVSGLGYVGIVLAAVLAIISAGIDLSSLAIVAGALSVGIGFGMQNIVSNFVSGIILLIERPVSVGDWISAGGQQGIVKRISVRSTQVETFDKTEVIVPNSDLISQPVTNWTRHNQTGRIIVPVGVAYGSDTRKVERVLREIIEDQPLVTIDPAPSVLFRGFGADSMDFEIRAVLSDVSASLGTTSEINHQIAERFAAEGIEIPFAQRDIWLRNPEALSRAGGGDGSERAGRGPGTPNDSSRPATASDIARKHDPRITFDDPDDAGAGGSDHDGGSDSR